MIGTEFLKGQGLGNRLFCYITARSLALDLGYEFGTAGKENLNADFLLLDTGKDIPDPAAFTRYDEADRRLWLPTSAHDMVHGIYVAGKDEGLFHLQDNTLIYGNLQDESYFSRHYGELSDWLRVKPEYESYEYTADDLCILNIRGGEYTGKPELFLRRRYYLDAMKIMRQELPAMRFMIVTDDEDAARRLFPSMEIHHFSPEKDYVTLKNARYLILSNSSFGFFPAVTSKTLKKAIAPKYWARHNVSDGYWASEQNIYEGFSYLGRDGKLYSARQCREELSRYVFPETHPWDPEDPMVEKVRKKNHRAWLAGRIAGRAGRMLGLIR